ncbi:cystathionine beta-lyase [Allorhizobium undicola]|uniref:cystathionine beta-lyase n=1 Tax=Allorhizobium undicola TaxID=78527 RepID=UPI003D33BD8D
MSENEDWLAKAGAQTRLCHSGYDPDSFHGFVNPPIVRASTVLFPNARSMEAPTQKYTYGTRGTPTTNALCAAIDDFEGSAGTILLPSGLAAVTVALLAYVSPGDHVLMVDSVYEPTRHFCNTMLKRMKVEVEYFDPAMGEAVESLFRPNTRLVHLEAPGSNTFEMVDVPLVAEIAHRHGAMVTMDNTWATALYFKALDFGVDVSIHAVTKYPSGHADVLMGTVSANAAHWRQLKEANGALGLCGSPEDSYMILRGLRSMGVRMAHHDRSARAVAAWLETRPDAARVLHPALESFPGHAIWKRDFKGAGGLFSFVLKGGEPDADKALGSAFVDALRLFGLGWSWGGYESLAVLVNTQDRTVCQAPGGGPVIRLQIGLEDVEDIIADLERGFAAVKALRG